MELKDGIFKLIKSVSCELPEDVYSALEEAYTTEESEQGKKTLEIILANIKEAKSRQLPICQDTGYPTFYCYVPQFFTQKALSKIIESCVISATQKGFLRPNAVNSYTGENSGNNIGKDFPKIVYNQWNKNEIEIKLMLKGGGCENVGEQYSLPNTRLKAGRNLAGVRKCIIDAVYKAQGMGCSPAILGVGIGGDRETSYAVAKKQLFRKLYQTNEIPELDEMEKELYHSINKLEIGPMGLGGNTTILGVKIGYAHRVPASFFVSIAYSCWATRRKTLTVYKNGDYIID